MKNIFDKVYNYVLDNYKLDIKIDEDLNGNNIVFNHVLTNSWTNVFNNIGMDVIINVNNNAKNIKSSDLINAWTNLCQI